MFNKQNLTEMMKEKEFGYGKWLIYFYATDDFEIEEDDVTIEILETLVKITTFGTDDETHERTEDIESIDYIPIKSITRISFVPDF